MKQNTKKMNGQFSRYRSLLISICLAAAIIAVYWPVYKYDFVKYDDDTYVTNNINIQSGLNFKSLHWAFTSGYASNWHPVTWISHILDYQIFKNWAGGHHITNILFHILNTLILFYVFVRMTGAIWPSAFIAAAFAIHPLHVESVAWIAERKDVLSTFFWLLTMLTYVQYVLKMETAPLLSRLCNRYYLLSIAFFVFGLMSKPMLVTVPFVLLLLDYWPLERKISRLLLIEKIPFFVCSFASCIITFLVQRKGGAVVAFESFGPAIRINNAVVSYVMYIIKMIWPDRLAVLYPYDTTGLSTGKVIIGGFVLLLISICFIYLARRRRFFAVGWLWYLGTLVPVIGLVQVGAQSMANRYTYITLTGLFVIITFGAKEYLPKWKNKNLNFTLLACFILAAWALTASRQVKCWKNSLTLFEHTLQVTENNSLILSNYATYLGELGRFDESIEKSNKFLKIKPDSAEAHNNLGSTLLKIDRTDEAIGHFRAAIKYNPNLPQASFNLAVALQKKGKLEEAVYYYKQALKIKPNYVDAYLNLAITLNELEKYDQAVEFFNKALEFDRNNIFAHGYRGMALAAAGETDKAIEEIRFVLTIRPNDVEMYRNLGILLERRGRTAEAIEAYRKALQIDPSDKNTKQFLEEALGK
ncbi:MAG: tetratricopeptide repeat protein [Phycisphaerae bacterium]|jgi:tetratricopeptide (TPR) repeat protein